MASEILTVIVAIATIATAVYTARAANAARKAAETAAATLELQRPHPIVIVDFSYSFAEMKSSMEPPVIHEFQVQNIGDSAAFDVEISTLETPGPVPGFSQRTRMRTDVLNYLLPSTDFALCSHELEPPHGALSLKKASAFLHDAVEAINEASKNHLIELKDDFSYEMGFTVKYRALDGGRFTQGYALVVNFAMRKGWVRQIGSLLRERSE